jgi:rare lipoprotein A
MRATKLKRRTATFVITALLLGLQGSAAGAFPHINRWYQYRPVAWTRTWQSVKSLRQDNMQWQANHPGFTGADLKAFQTKLEARYRARQFMPAASRQQSGLATWYSFGPGAIGACGKPLVGYYAASKTLPCGSTVSVRANGRYVLVTIMDRGPYGPGRILDLAPAAFSKLAPLGAGLVHVTAVRVRNP